VKQSRIVCLILTIVEGPRVTIGEFILVAAVMAFTSVAAVCDFRTKKLPNWLTVPGLVAALLYHLATGAWQGGWSGAGSALLTALGGFATGFGILLVLWLIGGGGAGDVKLMGALGAWLGPTLTLYVFFTSTVLVMVGSVGALAYQMISQGMSRFRKRYLTALDTKKLPKDEEAKAELLRKHKSRRRLMPYGVPVAMATWLVLAWQFVHI
jgi:prepilin peptidase CpaA